jgi:predicted aminopeptidase
LRCDNYCQSVYIASNELVGGCDYYQLTLVAVCGSVDIFMSYKKIIKRTLLGLLLAAIVGVIVFWDLVSYAARQGYGQLNIILRARPVTEYLTDPGFPDSLKARLYLIDSVRQYAIDSLGLEDTDNYKTLFDQQGKEIMWVVMACEPFRLQPKVWRFPIVGEVPYKGFFNRDLALNLQRELEEEGYDVIVRNPGGWSTLGWFTDPILSKMLSRSEGDLANLIIHEMSHATIFIKDSVDFNENLATFIGDRGAEQFLIDTYGENSSMYRQYKEEDEDYVKFVDHMLRGARSLDSLYSAMDETMPREQKVRQKEELIRGIIANLDTLSLALTKTPSKRYDKHLPNNAYFMNFRQYQSKQSVFWNELNNTFDGDLRAYIRHLSERFPFL